MSRRRLFAVLAAILLAVWTSIVAYQANFRVNLPHVFPPKQYIPCAQYLPAELYYKNFTFSECWQEVKR